MPSLRRGRRNIARLEQLAAAIANKAPALTSTDPVKRTGDLEKATARTNLLIEDAIIANLVSRGVRNGEIARLIGKSARTIARRVEMAKVTRALITSMLVDYAVDWKTASTNAALQGDHRPAMDAIAAVTDIQVVKKVAGDVGPKYQLQIGINLAGEAPRLPEAVEVVS